MSQQIGEGDDFGQKPSYGKSVEEAKSLIKQLEAFKSLSANTDSTTEQVQPTDTDKPVKNDVNIFGCKHVPINSFFLQMITYELYYTPEASKMQKESKLSDIDERIARIEKLVGSSAGQALDELVRNVCMLIKYSLTV